MAVAVVALVLVRPAPAAAQLGQLLSPGPLSKAHAALEGAAKCQSCHEPGRQVTAEKCLTCHEPVAERIRTRTGVHRDAAAGCVSCHVEHAGVNANIRPFDTRRFDHAAQTRFPLDGRHAPVAANCAACHKTRSFLTAKADCASCHADPHKGSLGAACATCHATSRAFKDALTTFDHSKAAFALAGAHRRVACESCHVKQTFKGLKFASCADCHRSPHRQPLGDTCATCHSPDTWKTKKIDHGRTGFVLRGSHVQLDCVKCHTRPPAQARLKFAKCADCHTDVHRGAFKQDCAACHNESRFGGAPFDHKTTAFPLDGKHAPLSCVSCHKRAAAGGSARAAATVVTAQAVEFKGLSTACASCHTDPHKNELGTRCEQCHTSATFKVSQFNHVRVPEFFGGQHAGVSCAACHIADGPRQPRRTGVPVDGWKFKNLPLTCSSCHADPHLGQLGASCETCHTVAAPKFQVARFDHARSKFTLTGAHAAVECAKCHIKEAGTFPAGSGTAVRFKGLKTDCASCHKDPHLGQLGTRCETCHSSASFKVARYTHVGNASLFAGKHTSLACADCHKREERQFPAGRGSAVRYKLASGSAITCATCHTDPHRGSLGASCAQCHTPQAWKTVSRAFHKVTQLPLEGRHLAIECVACHVGGVIKGTPTKCYDCHWIRRQDDRFRTALGNQCEQCHRPTSWLAINWNHGAVTGVALSPVHRAIGCASCHKNNQFKGTAPACSSCHLADYQRTTNPAHAAAGFPMTCELCHKPSHVAWSQARADHSTFPLVGQHAIQACAICHVNNVYKGTPRDCYSCHRTAYQNTTNPNHAAAGFPTTCESCHQPSAATWAASFNHNSVFPLVGLHATQACVACHVNNVYKGTPRDCYSCHRTAYQNTKNPSHVAAGFPTTCESCHRATDSSWAQGTFNHTAFPITSGRHANIACATCHTNPTSYKVFTCLTCHDRGTTDPKHRGVSGYVYDSQACYSCHPQGRAD